MRRTNSETAPVKSASTRRRREAAAPVDDRREQQTTKPALEEPGSAPRDPKASSEPKAETKKQEKSRGKAALVRDRFTMPKGDYDTLKEQKQRAARLGKQIRKSELLAAGVQVLSSLSDAEFAQALPAVSLPAKKKRKAAST